MTPDQIKVVVDAVFTELETLTASRPLLAMGVAVAHQLVDAFLLSRVAAKLNSPTK
jgi:hypothetical protein